MSDGNRTRNIRFGRPALSRLSFAHRSISDCGFRVSELFFLTRNPKSKIQNRYASGRIRTFRARKSRNSFTDCQPLPTGKRCVKVSAIAPERMGKFTKSCKMKKAEREMADFRRNCARTKSQDFFPVGTRQSLIREKKIFPNSLPFSFFARTACFRRHLRSPKRPTSGLFSVIQLSNIIKTKKAATFKFLFSRTFASPLQKQFLSSKTR